MSKEKDSFFEYDVKNKVNNLFILITLIHSLSILLPIILGIAGFANNSDAKFLIAIAPAVLFIYLVYIAIMPGPWYYKKIKELYDEKNERELVRIANNVGNRGAIALCALFDLNPLKVKLILDQYHIRGIPSKQDMGIAKMLTEKYLEYEAKQISAPTRRTKIQEIKAPTKKTEVQEQRVPSKRIEPKEKAISITKVYYLKNRRELGVGMISKMQLTMDSEIVICPYCSNMAKKDLLNKWLKFNKTCPVCSSDLIMDDCPVVDIRDH